MGLQQTINGIIKDSLREMHFLLKRTLVAVLMTDKGVLCLHDAEVNIFQIIF